MHNVYEWNTAPKSFWIRFITTSRYLAWVFSTDYIEITVLSSNHIHTKTIKNENRNQKKKQNFFPIFVFNRINKINEYTSKTYWILNNLSIDDVYAINGATNCWKRLHHKSTRYHPILTWTFGFGWVFRNSCRIFSRSSPIGRLGWIPCFLRSIAIANC